MSKPYIYLSNDEEFDNNAEFNIVVQETKTPKDYEPITEEMKDFIILYMRRIISHRFKECFKERFNIEESDKHMWNVQTRRRWKKYNRLVFERAVAAYLREAGREAEWHLECVSNDEEHVFKHRTSKRIAEFHNFYDMLEYGVFNIITNTDTTAVYFITSGYINGHHLSYKRFRALPYEHIAEVYRELTEMEKYPDGVFAIQTTMVFYNKKGMVYDVNYPPEKKTDGEDNE